MSSTEEDYIQNEYYAYNRRLFRLIGLWDYQRSFKKLIYVCFINLLIIITVFELYFFGIKSYNELDLPIQFDHFTKYRMSYYSAVCLQYAVTIILCTTAVANYSIFIAIILHACALFNVVVWKINERFENNCYSDSENVNLSEENEWIIDVLTSNIGKTEELTKLSYVIGTMFTIFAYFYFGQRLIDHNAKVTEFSNTVKAMTISKRLLGVSGTWPLEIRDSLFVSFIIYGCLFNILALLDLITYIKNFRYVMANIMENMAVVMTMTKILMLRIKYRSLSRFLIETKTDYIPDNYKNDEERLIFVKYNKLSYRFVIILFPWSTFLIVFYYIKAVVPNILMGNNLDNSNITISMVSKL
ncbi:hypothetical protein HZH66_015504 [Vespula vulgaris]|uniref:Odorant receptor n=1 Tax=Vespula vulgaris TaxID=7454 RepID=A0A834J130_VESVU|nr:hypothetical protein HZH66_015504 [Vespula vulgaris]